MNNAIVYSMHCSNPEIELNYSFRQLRYSLDTLRHYNKDIPVKVYLSPVGIFDTIERPIAVPNVEYIEFNAEEDPRFEHATYALWTSHKWPSTFDALERFGYDNVLYVDADTFWGADPQILFDKYGNSEYIWSKQDFFDDFFKFIKLNHTPMNDGVNLVSNKILKYKERILRERIERVLDWQEEFASFEDERLKVEGVQWAACQYAVSEYMGYLGRPVQFFDTKDVCLAHEYENMSVEDQLMIVVCHYLNYNTDYYLPAVYSEHVQGRISNRGII